MIRHALGERPYASVLECVHDIAGGAIHFERGANALKLLKGDAAWAVIRAIETGGAVAAAAHARSRLQMAFARLAKEITELPAIDAALWIEKLKNARGGGTNQHVCSLSARSALLC